MSLGILLITRELILRLTDLYGLVAVDLSRRWKLSRCPISFDSLKFVLLKRDEDLATQGGSLGGSLTSLGGSI